MISLFDGISCGLVALKRAGIKVTEYHAFENDKYAIQISKKNHPEIIHHGEINFMTDFSQFKGADLLIGGSPCQGFSIAGKGLNFKDPRSQLFFEFVRARNEIKPKNFLLENVKMKKEIQDAISKLMKCQPVLINSALVSGQNRRRLYWCNWKVEHPEDRNIFLADIIECGVVNRKKSYRLDASYWKGGDLKSYFDKSRRQLIFFKGRGNNPTGFRAIDGKVPTVTSNSWQTNNFLADVNGYRKLTPMECERLQTLDDNYTECVSNTQRYKAIGNGWTVDVIAHILKGMRQ